MAIIGISGKIGSGKDTVGKIIQYLTTELRHSYGFQDFINPEVNYGIENHPNLMSSWEIKKFAGKLKQIVSLLTGIPVEDLEKQEVKDRVLGDEWEVRYLNGLNPPKQNGMRNLTVREMLQKVGTEAIRNQIHPNAWVNALFADYKPKASAQFVMMDLGMSPVQMEKIGKPTSIEFPNWLITDVRFPNELQAIKDRGGIIIRVNRIYNNALINNDLHVVTDWQHPSETSLDNAEFDYTILNDGTLEELIEKVSIVYKQIQKSWKQE